MISDSGGFPTSRSLYVSKKLCFRRRLVFERSDGDREMSCDEASSAAKDARKPGRDSSFEETRIKSGVDNDRCASAREIQASRQASHSSGTRWFLHVVSGKGTMGGGADTAESLEAIAGNIKGIRN